MVARMSYVLMAVSAVVAGIVVVAWPNGNSDPVLRIDKAELQPREGVAGATVGLCMDGEWTAIPTSCEVKNSTRCSNNQYIASFSYPINLPAKPSKVNKCREGVPPREYHIPACPPGLFVVTRTLICQRTSWLGKRYQTEQPEASFSGVVLPP